LKAFRNWLGRDINLPLGDLPPGKYLPRTHEVCHLRKGREGQGQKEGRGMAGGRERKREGGREGEREEGRERIEASLKSRFLLTQLGDATGAGT
jgi:hypothetical protein